MPKGLASTLRTVLPRPAFSAVRLQFRDARNTVLPVKDAGSRELTEPRHAATALEAVFFSHRAELLSFFIRRGRRLEAEDLLHELWLCLPSEGAHIESPLSYIFGIANSLVIKLYHREMQGMRRDRAWSEATGPIAPDRSEQPTAERILESREAAAQVYAALAGEGERVLRVFHRHRVDGLTQVEVAREVGVSIRTVESDLHRARRVLAALRESADESLSSI